MTPRELIDAGCSARCLLAITAAEKCRCSCNGATHGLLANACVDGLLDGRRAGRNHLTDTEILAGVA